MARKRRRAPADLELRPLDSRPQPLTLVQSESVRWSRVRTAQARIAAGFYDRDDVRSRLADAVLRRMRRP